MKFALFSKILEQLDTEIVSLIYIYHKRWRREARWRYKEKFAISMFCHPEMYSVLQTKPRDVMYDNFEEIESWPFGIAFKFCRGDGTDWDFQSPKCFHMYIRFADRIVHIEITDEYSSSHYLGVLVAENGTVVIETGREGDDSSMWADISTRFAFEMLYRYTKRVKNEAVYEV